jgi:hypothetical protein
MVLDGHTITHNHLAALSTGRRLAKRRELSYD